MKKITVIAAVVFMMSVGSFLSTVQASSSWRLFGLEDEAIRAILPMAKAGTDNLLVGTAGGVTKRRRPYDSV